MTKFSDMTIEQQLAEGDRLHDRADAENAMADAALRSTLRKSAGIVAEEIKLLP